MAGVRPFLIIPEIPPAHKSAISLYISNWKMVFTSHFTSSIYKSSHLVVNPFPREPTSNVS